MLWRILLSSRSVDLHDPNLGLGSERNSIGVGYGLLIDGGFGIEDLERYCYKASTGQWSYHLR